MKVTNATQLIGKVVRFDDGTNIMLLSGGVGNGTTFTFKKMDGDETWAEMPMRESLPYVMELMKDIMKGE